MSRALIVLRRDEDRARAAAFVNRAPWGTHIEFKESKRSLPQNARMWVMLTEISQQMGWPPGSLVRLTADDWKLVFLDALKHELRIVPNINMNGFVNLGRSSSDLTSTEMSALMEIMAAFGAQHGVVFNDPAGIEPAHELERHSKGESENA